MIMETLTKRNIIRNTEFEATYILFNGQYINQDYFDDTYKKCEDCGEYHLEDEMTDVGGSSEYKWICESCLDDYGFCECCNQYTHTDNMVHCDWCDEWICEDCSHTDNNSTTICNGCYKNCNVCEDCGCFMDEQNSYYSESDGYYYCEDCIDSHNIIHEYGYKPEPEFYGKSDNNRYLGVELEVDKGDYCEETAGQIQDNNCEIYCKHDGSLNDGFEIVSHPCTLDYHLNSLDWKNIMQTCLDNSFLSHDAVTCGLHVHISRKAFGDNTQEQELNIAKLIYLFEKFWNQIKTFSRRTEKQINDWASNYGLTTIDEAITEAKNKKGRYFAVNLKNTYTVEIRIFRGTLKYNTFAATLQFINLLLDAITAGTIADIQSLTWTEIVNDAKQYAELTEYLKIRNLD
jgi:hypothetical protein